MISIAEIFDNSKEGLDSLSGFVDKYIGTELLRKCHITKVVDNVQGRGIYDYHDNPLLRLIGSIRESGSKRSHQRHDGYCHYNHRGCASECGT